MRTNQKRAGHEGEQEKHGVIKVIKTGWAARPLSDDLAKKRQVKRVETGRTECKKEKNILVTLWEELDAVKCLLFVLRFLLRDGRPDRLGVDNLPHQTPHLVVTRPSNHVEKDVTPHSIPRGVDRQAMRCG